MSTGRTPSEDEEEAQEGIEYKMEANQTPYLYAK